MDYVQQAWATTKPFKIHQHAHIFAFLIPDGDNINPWQCLVDHGECPHLHAYNLFLNLLLYFSFSFTFLPLLCVLIVPLLPSSIGRTDWLSTRQTRCAQVLPSTGVSLVFACLWVLSFDRLCTSWQNPEYCCGTFPTWKNVAHSLPCKWHLGAWGRRGTTALSRHDLLAVRKYAISNQT